MDTTSFDEAAQRVIADLKQMTAQEIKSRLDASQNGPFSRMADDAEGFIAFLTTEHHKE